MADETADSLREIAQHRGFKLVKSRRRKPGTGDFGKFGLTDDKGKPLLGIGEDGLTASADEIEDYLRAGAASTWQQSAKITPNRPAARSEAKRADPERRRVPGEAGAGGSVERSQTSSSRASREPKSETEAKPPAAARALERASRGEVEPNKSRPHSRESPASKRGPVEVELVLRPAKPADAGALAKLLSQLSGVSPSNDDVVRDLAALRKAGAGVHVAELGRVVGCVGWAVVATLQRGAVGRITVLVVEDDYRRQGIGTRLLDEAGATLAKKGCALMEAMSDIEIKNSHNFFRSLKFDQTSYRFARKIVR